MRRAARAWRQAALGLACLAGLSLPGVARAGDVVVIGDGSGFVAPQVQALSADGSVAGGVDVSSEAFLWNGGFVPVPALPGGSGAIVLDLSADGSVAVGSASDASLQHPFRWTSAEGSVALGTLVPGSSGSASAVSADGSVIVGNSGGKPFRWTASAGMLPLSGVDSGRAWDVSADGQAVTGFSIGIYIEAYRWTQATGPEILAMLPGYESASAQAISADGSTIVGGVYDEDTDTGQAFRWTQAEGMVGIGNLPGCTGSVTATDVSADGGVIVGECWLSDGVTRRQFVWTAATALLPLDTFLTARGVELEEPLVDPEITAVSTDGRVLAVVDSDPSQIRSYLIDLTPPAIPALSPLAGLGLALALVSLARVRGRPRQRHP